MTYKQIKKLLLTNNKKFLYIYKKTKTNKILNYIHTQLYKTIYSQTLLNILKLTITKKTKNHKINKQLIINLKTKTKKYNLSTIHLNSKKQHTTTHQFYKHINYISNKKQKQFIKYLNT